MWDDPEDIEEKFHYTYGGYGFMFGNKAVEEFNTVNGLDLLAR